MNFYICLVYCLLICFDLIAAHTTTRYYVELVFSNTDPAFIKQNVTAYLREKNIDVYVDNITVT